MAEHNKLGEEGELRARNFLIEKGYKILAFNWRFGHYELDIVAETDEFLVVVEVKSRSTLTFEHPKDAITPAKIRRTVAAAHEFVLQHNIDKDVRFDVISAIPLGAEFLIEHTEDAFLAPVN